MTTTAKYGIPELDPNGLVKNGPADVNTALAAIDSTFTGYAQGPLSSRPTSTAGSPGIAGRFYRATDTGQVFQDTGTGWTEPGTMAGDIKATARASAPDGWLLCDGSPVSRTTYATLFAALGTTYGAGDGSTTFNVPDLRGRVPVGADGTAGRLSGSDALGNAAGAEKHTLTAAELPTGHYPVSTLDWSKISPNEGTGSLISVITTTGGITNVVGSGTSHSIMQPYQIVNYIVKA